MELFLSLLFWLFGQSAPGSQINPVPLNSNVGNQNYYVSQPASPASQPVIEMLEGRRSVLRNGIHHTIIIFEDTHFRPVKN